jgi:hypothetical protein
MKLFPSYCPQLQCQLQTISLNEPFNYEAISYVWGDTTIKVDMVCDNHLVGIQPNLCDALRHLRYKTRPRYLWADAICIDQSNLHERSAQVALMKKIFAKASRVLSWLGPEDERDADALSFIEKIGKACCESNSISLEEVALTIDLDKFVMGIHLKRSNFWLDDHHLPSWPSLFRFFELPYFSRVWTANELQSNPNVRALCGKVEIDYGHIPLTAAWLKYADNRIFSQIVTDRGIGNIIHIRKVNTFDNSLLGRLHSARGFFASDPRDKIFVFASNFIPIDYTKSSLDVFQDVAVTLLRGHGYDCFSYVVHKESIGYPSWVPKFDYSFIKPLITSPTLLAGGDQAMSQWKVRRHSIFLHAFLVDTVSITEKVMAWSNFDANHHCKWASSAFIEMWKRYTANSEASAPYLSGCTLRTAFSLTLTAGLQQWAVSNGISYHQQAFEKYAEKFAKNVGDVRAIASRKVSSDGDLVTDDDEFSVHSDKISNSELSTTVSFRPREHPHPNTPSVNKFSPHGDTLRLNIARDRWPYDRNATWPLYQRDAQLASNHRRIFRTNNGYLGLGPKLTRGGASCQVESQDVDGIKPDELWVILGAKTPFILRPRGGHYQLVGECYVHGLMDGSLIRGLEDSPFQVQEIEVC